MKLLSVLLLIGCLSIKSLNSQAQVDTAWISQKQLTQSTGIFFGEDSPKTRRFCLNLENGILQGKSTVYIIYSNLYIEQNFVDNLKEGDTFYYKNGKLITINQFIRDTLVSETVFSKSGHKIITTYNHGLMSTVKIYKPSGVLEFEKILSVGQKVYSIWYRPDMRIKKVIIWQDGNYESEFRMNNKVELKKFDNISKEEALLEYDFLKTRTRLLW